MSLDAFMPVLATVAIAVVFFAVFALILAFPALRGRKIKRKCACAGSREVLRILEERERAARNARMYRPATADASSLPMVSAELAEFARRGADAES